MFKKIVEKVLRKNGINPETYNYIKNEIEKRTHNELLDIFGLKNSINETTDDQTFLWLARSIYSKFLENIQNHEYEKINENTYIVDLEDLQIVLNTNNSNYNLSTYDHNKKIINVVTRFSITDIIKIAKDPLLKSNLMHEITHYLTFDNDDNSLPWNYKDPSNSLTDYYVQKPEMQSNKVAICDFIISFIKENLQQTLNVKDLNDSKELQNYIDKVIKYFINTKGTLYHSFFEELSKDAEAFESFYEDVVTTIIDYIQNNLEECVYISAYNYLSENIKNK